MFLTDYFCEWLFPFQDTSLINSTDTKVYLLYRHYILVFLKLKSDSPEDGHCREWPSYEEIGTRSSVTPLNNFCLILAAPISFKSSLKWLTFVEVHIVYGNGQKKKVPSQQVPAIKKPIW